MVKYLTSIRLFWDDVFGIDVQSRIVEKSSHVTSRSGPSMIGRMFLFSVLWGGNFHTPLPLNRQKGQRLPAPEVYKNQSPHDVSVE